MYLWLQSAACGHVPFNAPTWSHHAPGAPQSLLPVWSQIGGVLPKMTIFLFIYLFIFYGIKASLLTWWHFLATEALLSRFEAASSCCGDTLVPLRLLVDWRVKWSASAPTPHCGRGSFLRERDFLLFCVAPLLALRLAPFISPSLGNGSASLYHFVGSVNKAGTSWRALQLGVATAKLLLLITG